MKSLRVFGLVALVVLALMALAVGPAIAGSTIVDQKVRLDLKATMHAPVDASGEATLELRIAEDGTLETFKARADADGLLADVTYSLWVYGVFIGSDVADANGSISIDVVKEGGHAHFMSLAGFKVKIIEGATMDGTVVLKGMVPKDLGAEADIRIELEEEEEEDSVL